MRVFYAYDGECSFTNTIIWCIKCECFVKVCNLESVVTLDRLDGVENQFRSDAIGEGI